MDISLDKKSETLAIINLQLNESDYKAEFTKKLKEYAQKGNFKGFRPGKAPMGFVKKLVGADLKGQLLNDLVSKSISDYIKEEKIEILFYPTITSEPISSENIMATTQFDSTFEICLKPTVTYNLSEIEIPNYEVAISDSEIATQIESFRKGYAGITDKDEVVAEAFVEGTFKSEGKVVFEETATLPLDQIEEKQQAAFLGKKVEDVITFNIEEAFGEESSKKMRMLFGEKGEKITGDITLTISKITKSEDAELNQDLFDKALGKDKATNEEEFTAGVKTFLEQQHSKETEILFGRTMSDILKEKIEVPTFDRAFLENLIKMNNESTTEEKKIKEEDLDFEINNMEKYLNWEVISKQIFTDANLKLEEKDIDDAATNLARTQLWQMGITTDEFVDMFKQQMLNGENATDESRKEIYDEAFFKKLLTYVRENAKVTTSEVSADEIREIFEELNKPAETPKNNDSLVEDVRIIEETTTK